MQCTYQLSKRERGNIELASSIEMFLDWHASLLIGKQCNQPSNKRECNKRDSSNGNGDLLSIRHLVRVSGYNKGELSNNRIKARTLQRNPLVHYLASRHPSPFLRH